MGTTRENGELPVTSMRDYPLTIRGISIQPTEIKEYKDTVSVESIVYYLPELTIKSGDRPIVRIIGYIRTYNTACTSGDTLQLYREFMTESFETFDKVKGYKNSSSAPRILNERRMACKKSEEGTIKKWSPADNNEIMMLTVALPPSKIPANYIHANFKDGDNKIYKQGKHSILFTCERKGGNIIVTSDKLANYEGHRWKPNIFKLIGCTVEFEKLENSYIYAYNNKNTYGLDDFIYGTFTFKFTGLGKVLKKLMKTDDSINFYGYDEIYPVAYEYLTIEEYKDLLKNKQQIHFKIPESVLPLPAPVKSMLSK